MSILRKLILYLLVLCYLNKITCRKSHQRTPIKIIWNVKSFQCAPHGFNFIELLDKHNIIHNEFDSFNGNIINLFYDPGKFPAILTKNNQEYLRNGGVPQDGKLNNHLESFEKAVEKTIPDVNNHGLAVIDQESWRPIYRQNWGKLLPYQTLSEDKEMKKHPTYSNEQIVKAAAKRFEDAAFEFMEETIKVAKQLRPNALWGYYHYPYCHSTGKQDACSMQVVEENDRLRSLYQLSDVLYPSVYLKENHTAQQRIRFIRASLDEAIRINSLFQENKKIYVYYWYKYQDSGNFLPKEELANTLRVIASYKIDGLILWGANADVNTSSKCAEVYEYINEVFGPTLRNI